MENDYTIDQLQQASIEYFNDDVLASNVWMNKYALKRGNTYLELTPTDTTERMVREIHRAELQFPNPLSIEEIRDAIGDFKHFIFGGSILFGLGNDHQVSSLGNCFFIDNATDSYGGIFNLDESAAQLMKRRGGVGITLEHLRPTGTPVNNSAHSSTGATSFMHRFSNTTREVAQDGRRGALMLTIHVGHPDVRSFVMMKDDRTKVTGANISVKITDDFMKAVESDSDYYLKWPINRPIDTSEVLQYNKLYKRKDGTHVVRIKARDLWNTIVKQAHKNAEPGVIFWDRVIQESPADCYSKDGMVTTGTNPCIVGETLIAVADGRNAVSIKQLVDENKDVPVYCINDKGQTDIQLMRNPRITGYNMSIYEVKLDSGDSIRVTGNHKIRLKDGSYKEAKDLQYGDSLHVSTISYSPIINKGQKYRWIKSGEDKRKGKGLSEHRAIYEYYHNIKIPKGYIIHHKDYNALNNNIDNLEMMSKYEHDVLHTQDMIGEKNPYHKMSKEWKKNFASHPGLTNPKAYQISNEELINKGTKLGKQLGRRFSKDEWINFAEKNNLPKFIKSYRGFNGITEFSKYIANELGFEYNNLDTRIVRRYKDALLNGYHAKIENNILLVERTCEECGGKFWTNFDTREYSFCSKSCSNLYLNRNTNVNERRTETINKTYKEKGELNKENQLRILSQLKFELNREPSINEWFEQCKKEKVPFRLGTKYGFKSWDEVKEYAEDYNHKVVSVNLIGNENVYNGTVDKYHNFFTVLKSFDKITNSKQFIINQLNCGEVPLSPFDSCRLGSINLNSMVLNPYTDKAKIDWKLLARISHLSQRFMDDIVTLEEEKVLAIIKKIENDPEDQEYRQVELNLWNKVLTVLRKGRRTGLGVLGLGDMLAKLGVKYDTPESTKLKEEIVKCIAVNSYKESVTMAKERGAFPLWDADTEAHNPIVRRIVGDNFSEAEYIDYLQYGRRNIANMAIAPTGSLAILCQTTSGIEPVFKITYKRKRKVNPNDKNLTRPTTTDDTGDTWEEYPVFHHEFVKWFATLHPEIESPEDHLENLSDDEVDELVMKSPWWGSESHDIDPIEKVKSQGAIQRWVDHSISVTHNLPEKSTLDEVSRIYFEAWKAGCKGCTIYREGSRDGVLITKKKKEKFDEHHAPKRPKELTGDYYIATVKGQRYGVIVGLLQDRPYEIFAFANPEIRDTCRGKITKVRKGFYEFECDKGKISGLHLAAEALEERAHTIWVSMLLRHGAPIEHIVNVAKKVDDNISSFSSVVRRTLSRYIKSEGTEDKCPACEIGKLIREEGCIHCDTCDYSKC